MAEVASGFRFQVRQHLSPWVSKLWVERPVRYSRALLETLSLIAYRQPITRGIWEGPDNGTRFGVTERRTPMFDRHPLNAA